MYPYYKLKRTKEDKDFFFNNVGFFNFLDEMLILHTQKMKNYYKVIVNRTGKKFREVELQNEVENEASQVLFNSLEKREPSEMYKDFPELNNIKYKLRLFIS